MNFGKRESVKVMAGGHDVTAQMPKTAATLEAQRPRQMDIEEFAPVYQQTNDDPLLIGGPMPKTIGRCADLYSDIRTLRLAMDKEVEAVKARESQIREYIIANLSKSAKDGDSGASGLRYRAQIVSKDVPRAKDWKQIYKYIADNDRFDLLHKRLGEQAVMDMWEDKQVIPGIEIVKVPDVSITKIGK